MDNDLIIYYIKIIYFAGYIYLHVNLLVYTFALIY